MHSRKSYPGPEPRQPQSRPFLRDLVAPLHQAPLRWARRQPRADEISLQAGLQWSADFPDPAGRLETAWQDFSRFCRSAGIRRRGALRLIVRSRRFPVPESYRITVGPALCEILAGDTEGLRRALIYMEDEMLRRQGPFLPRGCVERRPVIRSRLILYNAIFQKSRGQAGRLPEGYLNRMAHQGVNGIMLPLGWIYRGRLAPEIDGNKAELFRRLQQCIDRYGRYGIKVYPYVIEPQALPFGSAALKKYPKLAGHPGDGYYHYCTSQPAGRACLTRCMRELFAGAPGLGGLVTICVGERSSHCWSAGGAPELKLNLCPRCSRRAPQAVLADTLNAIARGIHAAAPEAEFIAWPYSQYMCWGEQDTRAAAAHIPPGVILMHNLDSAGKQKQLGKMRRADDYWLSYTGPSRLFTDCARAARRHGTRMFAKFMVGSSHEQSSVPYLPVPGVLYRRFRALRRLGVSGAVQNWDSGNDPSVMNRAAGDLAFDPFPASERAFLLAQARRDWGALAPAVARAWQHFDRAFAHMPLAIGFSYHGPMHSGPVWPLFLEPQDLRLPRNWCLDPWSGDRIGDATGYHTLAETIALSERMLKLWRPGVRLLESLRPRVRHDRERRLDIALARTLELIFESGVRILRFYALREAIAREIRKDKLKLLADMRAIVKAEMALDRKLLSLVREHPRLGYCTEAGGFKFFPEKIKWRIKVLRRLLREQFPPVAARLRRGLAPFPHYTGAEPRGPVIQCPRVRAVPGFWKALPEVACFATPGSARGRRTRCRAGHDRQALYFRFDCREPRMSDLQATARDRSVVLTDDLIWINIEISQFKPMHRFKISANGAREYLFGRAMNDLPPQGGDEPLRNRYRPIYYRWTTTAGRTPDGWFITVRIPFASLGIRRFQGAPLRINFGRRAGPAGKVETSSWVPPARPRAGRGIPANYGWLIFTPGSSRRRPPRPAI